MRAGRDAEPPGRAVPRSRQEISRAGNGPSGSGASQIRNHPRARYGSIGRARFAGSPGLPRPEPAGPLQLVAALACQATAPATTNAAATIDVTISLRIRISPPNGFSYRLHPRKSYNDSSVKLDGALGRAIADGELRRVGGANRTGASALVAAVRYPRARVDVAGRLALQKRRHQDAGPGRRGGPRPVRSKTNGQAVLGTERWLSG